ncbi:SDR family NAD(P)-dependent oxidoreductase [Mycolicibacterium arseniciresistens]|uniref:SDR family NAD(P)-dependent oxidoreductase n=1 Tax=Mycolicibacterium arseniciresistens TaxID=3062257 RepID=A0ABT8UQD4_9MYCO|nr:SDR family NAD(P)-dependent oxidoreductase [Mycolicibacterium arseniciresistens]MDO3639356.1 SDR family NAD(P)-dependent oxidoreductase [Mycolicibacterium arseniciresistens]
MTVDRTAVITGANSGLGFECVRALLDTNPSWHIVLAVRDAHRGAEAVGRLGSAARCTVLPLDLASLTSVRDFPTRLAERELPPLRALVCNAGLQVVSGLERTPAGVELTFGVNHLGHFALVDGLLDQLAPPARVVIVSSGTHDPAKFSGMPKPQYNSAEELAHPADGASSAADGRRRYTTSKLCNVLYAYELDRRLDRGRRGVTVNAFDPGLMPGSGLARDYSTAQRFLWRHLFPALRVLPGVRSTRASGRHLAALAADPRFDDVTGRYFSGRRPIRSSADSYDTDRARDLWETSERLLTLAI